MNTFVPLKLAIVTISDTRTLETDQSGYTLEVLSSEAGHQVVERSIVRDDRYAIREKISALIVSREVQVILTTGGTGITGRDVTPEAITPLLDSRLEGFGELFRMISFQEVGTAAMQSRAFAGVANGKYLFCLPGSTNACRTAWNQILSHQFNAKTSPCNLAGLLERLKESHDGLTFPAGNSKN